MNFFTCPYAGQHDDDGDDESPMFDTESLQQTVDMLARTSHLTGCNIAVTVETQTHFLILHELLEETGCTYSIYTADDGVYSYSFFISGSTAQLQALAQMMQQC